MMTNTNPQNFKWKKKTPMPPTFKEYVETILASVLYKDWKFEVTSINNKTNSDLFLRVKFMAPDNTERPRAQGDDMPSGVVLSEQYGRRWLIEYGSTPTLIVQSAWLAVQRAEMHEIAEQFRYCGETIFNRHIDVRKLVKIAADVE
jgi:hypothetical protein